MWPPPFNVACDHRALELVHFCSHDQQHVHASLQLHMTTALVFRHAARIACEPALSAQGGSGKQLRCGAAFLCPDRAGLTLELLTPGPAV